MQRPSKRALPLLAITALGAVLAASTPAIGANESSASEPTGEVPAALQRSAEFRADLGLPVDLELMQRLADGVVDADWSFGVPLTRVEAKEVHFRQTVIAEDAPAIRSALASAGLQDSFGGMFMDNQTGRLTVLMTESGRERAAEVLAAAVRYPDRLALSSAVRTYADLEGIQSSIEDMRATFGVIAATSLDEVGNQVVVAVVPSSDASELVADLNQRFGEGATRVEYADPMLAGSKAVNSPPHKGGLQINDLDSICTSAFIAESSTATYLLSAGHCGPVGEVFDQQGVLIGRVDRSDVDGTDMLRIPIPANLGSNLVTIRCCDTLGNGVYRAITGSQARNADVIGETSCYSGINTTSLQCGTLKTKTYSLDETNSDGRRVRYTTGREFSFDCNHGDSGGPVLYGGQARGIISAKITRTLSNDTCVAVHIWDVLAQGFLVRVRQV